MTRRKRTPLSANVIADTHYTRDSMKERERRGLTELEVLALDIKDEFAQAEHILKTGFQHAIRTGELLATAKGMVPHGEWATWLAEQTEIPMRRAQMYMRAAREFAALPASKAKDISHLTLSGFLADQSTAKPKAKDISHSPSADRAPAAASEPTEPSDDAASVGGPQPSPEAQLEARLLEDINAYEGRLSHAAVRRILEKLIGRMASSS